MSNIGICGAGLIGASWAVGYASTGYNVFIYDSNSKVIKSPSI